MSQETIDEKTVSEFYLYPEVSNLPHRVKFQGINKFYKRANASRYEIPIEELRKDFLGGTEFSKKISEFRSERIIKILSNDTPITVETGPKLVLHIIPIHYFDNIQAFESLNKFENNRFSTNQYF